MKSIRLFAIALCGALALSAARATTVIPPSFDQLVQDAEFIFEGTVTNVQSQWVGEGGQRHIMTYVTVAVDEAVKGNPGASYTLSMLGGTVGDQTLEVSDAPKFAIGDHDILFVEHNGTQFIPLVGIMHGRFRVAHDDQAGADMVLSNAGNPVTDLNTLGRVQESAASKGANTNAIQRPFDAASFKDAIRNKLAGQ